MTSLICTKPLCFILNDKKIKILVAHYCISFTSYSAACLFFCACLLISSKEHSLDHFSRVSRYDTLTKILQISASWDCFPAPKYTINRLAAGFRPDPLGELTALPQTP